MENYSTNISNIFVSVVMEPIKKFLSDYELDQKMRKRYELSKSIFEIISELSKEDLFEDVDKVQLFKFLNSRIHLLEPYDIKKDELARRLRKIIAVEAMSRILDGLSPEEVKELERSYK